MFILICFLIGMSGILAKPEYCNLPPITGNCRAAMPRYYYNPVESTCELFIYGGCQGNPNKFKSKDKCMKTCA